MKLDWTAMAMGAGFCLMWSSAFSTTRIIVLDASPLWVLALRFAIAGGLAVGVARARGQSWHLPPMVWRSVVIFGICQNAIYLGMNFVALQWVEGALGAVIASSMPLMVAAIGWGVFGERLRPLGLAGLAAGFAGVALIAGARITQGAPLGGVALCLTGALALAVATRLVRSVSAGGDLLMVVGLQMLVGAAVLAAVGALVEVPRFDWSPRLVAALTYQIFVPGLAATVLWFALVQRIGAIRASTFHFLNPFFGVVIAALLLGEHVSASDLVGVAIAMAGILAVQVSRAG